MLELSKLSCPRCRAEGIENAEEALRCSRCGARYPVRGGIPRFVEQARDASRQVQRVFDFEHRLYRDSQHTRFSPELVSQFLADCGLPPEFFRGQRALDAGCGSGRWTYALAELGADVTGCDLTASGVEMAHEELGDRANVAFVQADLFALPFPPASFDFVMSWGVLHHTRDTRAAFGQLVPLVRPGGTLFVMVYESVDRVRERGTNVLRTLLRRLPDDQRYRLCARLVLRKPLVYAYVNRLVTVALDDPAAHGLDRRTLQFGLFDAYSPRWNHVHSRDEVRGWFEQSGFEDVMVLPSPSGAVKVRGVRT